MNGGGWVRAGLAAVAAAVVVGTSACTGADDAPPDADDGTALTLDVEGFGTVRLGDSFESVTEALSARWGPADRTSEMVCESNAQSEIVTWDGALLVFNDQGLAGYQVGPRPADAITPIGKDLLRAATPQGLRLGDTVDKARQIYGDSFVLDDTSLGPEWYIAPEVDGDPVLRGFAAGLAGTDTVDRIGAGDICAVR